MKLKKTKLGSGILTDVLNVSIFTAHHRRIVVARRNRRLLLQLLALGGFGFVKTVINCFRLPTQRAPLVGLKPEEPRSKSADRELQNPTPFAIFAKAKKEDSFFNESLKNTIIFATMRHQKSQLCIYSLNISVVLRECLIFKGIIT